MGGGAGVTIPGVFRVATDKTVFATPETLIGFHPDAGASFHLSHLPSYLGQCLVSPSNNKCFSLKQEKPVILTVASMDSASFFRNKSLGADSPIYGMISLLAAVDALSRIKDLDTLAKQGLFETCLVLLEGILMRKHEVGM